MTYHRRRRQTTVDGEPRKHVTSALATKSKLEKGLRAHSDHVGQLGKDGDPLEWPVHGEATTAALCSAARKTTAVRALRVVAVDASGRGGAQDQDGCIGRICVARGGSTEVTASGGAAVAAETEGK
jgi:hypothetical protein